MQELRILREALRDAWCPDERAIIMAGIARLETMLATMTTAHMPVVRQEESVAA